MTRVTILHYAVCRLDVAAAKHKARQRRLKRKLLEKQRISRETVPIFQVQETKENSYHPYTSATPDLICHDQLYRVWGAVPPANKLWERRRAMLEERRERGRHMNVDRDDPDGGEDDTDPKEQSIEKVIQSARDVRRLISNHSYNFQQGDIEIVEDTPDLEYLSNTNTPLRDSLQLSSIKDNLSDTSSNHQSSKILFCSSAPRLKRRQSVLSCSSMEQVDFEDWEWEDMVMPNLEISKDKDLVIRCGDITTFDTSINMQ